jgi:hypothetical protein
MPSPRTRVLSLPLGAGKPETEIIMPTFARPANCNCSWRVVREGPGMSCLSQLVWKNALCPVLRQHRAPQPQDGAA